MPYLRVNKVLAVKLLLSGARVPGEEDTGTRSVAHVSEHHGLHVDGRALQPGDLVNASVLVCPRAVPGVEHGAHRQLKLLLRVYKANIEINVDEEKQSFSFEKLLRAYIPEGNGSPLASM